MTGFSCQLVVDEAVTWLTRQQEENPRQSFFMYVAFHEPHEPVASPPERVDAYRGVAKNEDQAQYFANVNNLDAAVGKLLAALKDMDLDKDTLVIFTSDNGPETLLRYGRARRSFGTAEPLRGMKLWTTDAGFRVAGIMRWPEKIKAGQVVNHPVSSLDFFPTFCHLAGIRPPAGLLLDGTSFLPALENKPPVRENPLLWVFYNAINERRVAMRDGDWKVLAKLNIDKYVTVSTRNEAAVKAAVLSDFQIFRVIDDMGESNDLSQSHPQTLAELSQRLNTHYRALVRDSYVWSN